MKMLAELIVDCCKKFYTPKIRRDHEFFYKSCTKLEQCNKLLLDVKFDDNEFPIRIGRFSHIECTTVDNLRRPVAEIIPPCSVHQLLVAISIVREMETVIPGKNLP